MPVMPDAAFIRQKQNEPLVIDGTPHPCFFARTSYNLLAALTGQSSIVLPPCPAPPNSAGWPPS